MDLIDRDLIGDMVDAHGNVHYEDIMNIPSAQPEYYDYSDIEHTWNYYAEENDINLTANAKQIKDAMWVGYRKGKESAQPEIIRCEDCMHNGSFDTDCPIGWNGKEYCSFAERRTDDLQ